MKRSLRILLISLGALVMLILVVVANVGLSRSTVSGIEVKIRYGGTPPVVDAQTVRDSVVAAMPGLLQCRVGQVDRQGVVEAASRVPYLKAISASTSMSGRVVIRATQRRPIARLFHSGKQYYFDDAGVLMPAVSADSLNLLVAGGDFGQPLHIDSLDIQVADLWKLASFLDSQRKYGDLIDQIYSERGGNLMIVPKLGNHVVELGSVDGLDDKFSALLAFYLKGMPRAGWDSYSRISLKYKGQVVATKRNARQW